MNRGKYMVIAPVFSMTVRTLCSRLQNEVQTLCQEAQIPTWNYQPNKWDRRLHEHVTLLPPFFAHYEFASAINNGIAVSLLKHQEEEHPAANCPMTVGELSWFREGDGFEVLKLEVSSARLLPFATQMRRFVENEPEALWCSPVPQEVNLHITICTGNNIHDKLKIRVNRWNAQKAKLHHVRVPDIYLLARYKTGWHMLSHDPTWET